MMASVARARTRRAPSPGGREPGGGEDWPVGRHAPRKLVVLGAGASVLAACIVIAVSVGASGVSVVEAARAIGTRLNGTRLSPEEMRTQTIVWQLRLPRVCLAVAAGAGLSVSGVVMQGLLHNPLVSPFTLGISSAAAFGASLALLADASVAGSEQAAVVVAALVVALGCAGLAIGLSATRGLTPQTLILVGLALTYLFAALTAVVQYLATDEQLAEIVRWTFGSVNGATWTEAALVAAIVAASLPVLVLRSSALNAVAFAGDDAAASLGVNVARLRLVGSVVAVALAATVVSFTGVIGFVGLVGPHVARLVIGPDHRYLVPFAAISGAVLLLAADTAGRTVVAPAVIPVGIVVSLVGAPLFLNLVLARRRSFL